MRSEQGVAYPEGDLTLAEAVRVMREGEQQLTDGVTVFDLSGLVQVDSSALSLLLRWRRSAAAQGRQVEFRNTPESLQGLAKLYGVTELVDLA